MSAYTLPSLRSKPVAAASKDQERPALCGGSLQPIVHPLTGEEGMYICTTNSYIMAAIPVKGPQRKTAIHLDARLVKELGEPESVLSFEPGGQLAHYGLKGSFATPEFQYPQINQIVPQDLTDKELPEVPPKIALNPYLIAQLGQALGCPKPSKKSANPGGRGPMRFRWKNPLRALVVVPMGFDDDRFGLLMPVRDDG